MSGKKMAEYKKKSALSVTVAVFAVLMMAGASIYLFPSGLGQNSVSISTNPGGNVTTGGGVYPPKALLGYASANNVSCSLATASCTMTITNNSTTPIEFDGCQMLAILSSNSTYITVHTVQGVIEGASGITAQSSARVTCSLTPGDVKNQTTSSHASGIIETKLVNNWYGYNAGTQTTIDFTGFWT